MSRHREKGTNAPPAGDAARSSPPGASREGTASGVFSHDEVARRAYDLFVERGGEPGRDWEDWLRAEAELRDGRR